jgi:hypothetical protein
MFRGDTGRWGHDRVDTLPTDRQVWKWNDGVGPPCGGGRSLREGARGGEVASDRDDGASNGGAAAVAIPSNPSLE